MTEPASETVDAARLRVVSVITGPGPSIEGYIKADVDALLAAIRAESDERVAALTLALIGLDDAWRWVEEHYPKVLVEMPSLEPFSRARAALSDTSEDRA